MAGRNRHRVIDPYCGYAQGLAEGLPRARLVVDHFHAVRLANQVLGQVRRRTQQSTLGHRGRKAWVCSSDLAPPVSPVLI